MTIYKSFETDAHMIAPTLGLEELGVVTTDEVQHQKQ